MSTRGGQHTTQEVARGLALLPSAKAHTSPDFVPPFSLQVLILEKAFAKFCGGYGHLNGGHEIWAFEALTGDPVMALMRKDGVWTRYNLSHMEGKKRTIGLRKTKESYDDGQCFGLLRSYLRAKAAAACVLTNAAAPCGAALGTPRPSLST